MQVSSSPTSSNTYDDLSGFDVEIPFCIAFCAPTKSGKTELAKKCLLRKWQYMFHNIVIASPTLQYKGEYDEVVDAIKSRPYAPNIQILKTNLELQINQVITEQEELKRRALEEPENFDKTDTLLILDDCIGTNLFRGNRVENVCDKISCVGRHFDLSLVIMSQKLSKISIDIRQNLTCLFVFAPLHFADIERILDEYVPQEVRPMFRKMQQEVFREPYAFIIIDGSPKRRTDFRLRIRKGFKEYLFDPNIPIENLRKQYLIGNKSNS